MKTKEIDKALMAKAKPQIIRESDWLSTGSIMLNLAISGRARGGITKNHYIWFLGDSETGKSVYALKILAEASINPNFAKYRLIYDDIETGIFQFPIAQFYGASLARRIEPLNGSKARPKPSRSIQEFYRLAFAALKAGPCIIVQDSMDALDEEKELKDFEAASENNKSTAESYGMGKAKENSKNMKRLVSCLPLHGSILLVINQTRENLNRRGPYDAKTKPGAGGMALRFYAHAQLWTSIVGKLEREIVKDKKVKYGDMVSIAVKKNRISGRAGSIKIPFLRQAGFDDIGSTVDWLVEWGHWKKSKGQIAAVDFNTQLSRVGLIMHIESKPERIEKLKDIAQKHWDLIESKVLETRRNPYTTPIKLRAHNE